MVVHQIRIGSHGKDRLQIFKGFLSLPEAGPQADDPRPGPAGMAAAVCQTPLERHLRGLHQLPRLFPGNGAARIDAVHMGNVPVSRLRLFIVLHPLHQLPVFSDFQLRETGHHFFRLSDPFLLQMKRPAGVDIAGEQLQQDLRIHRRALAEHAQRAVRPPVGIFRRHGGRGHQAAVLSFDQEVVEEEHALLQHVKMLPQERLVPGIQILLPDMGRKPGFPHDPEGGGDAVILRRGIPVQVRIVMRHAAPAAVHPFRRFLPAFLDPFQQIKQR